MKSLIFLLFVAMTGRATSPPRQTVTGYLKSNSRGEVFFVKNPKAIESGVLVVFENPKENRKSCKVTTVIPQIDCPSQTFSFVWGQKSQRPAMLSTRIEDTSSSWHHRQRTVDLFK